MAMNDLHVVLVHGAWADGSSWAKVVGPLTAARVCVTATSLPLTSFEDDVAALNQALERIAAPVVLAGHAYAGAVIGATRYEKVKGLVYVAGLAPEQGETVLDVFTRVAPHPKAPKLEPNAHGMVYLPKDAFGAAFAPNASSAEQAVLAAVQRPISLACITDPLKNRPRWKDVPTWYLVAEQDRMIAESSQLFMAERMEAAVRSYPVDHTPLVTAPSAVLDVIREAVSKAAA